MFNFYSYLQREIQSFLHYCDNHNSDRSHIAFKKIGYSHKNIDSNNMNNSTLHYLIVEKRKKYQDKKERCKSQYDPNHIP